MESCTSLQTRNPGGANQPRLQSGLRSNASKYGEYSLDARPPASQERSKRRGVARGTSNCSNSVSRPLRISGLFHPPRRPPTAPLPEPSTPLSTARAVLRDQANPTRQRVLLRALEHQRVE